MKKRTESFDCVEMKRRGAELVRQRLAGMSRQEELAYWRRQTELLLERQSALRASSPPQPAGPNASSAERDDAA